MEQLASNKWEFLATQWGDSLAHYLVAIVLGWAVLKILDKLAGIDFSEDISGKLDAGNMAWALYLGFRFWGVCYLGYAFIK